VVFEISFVEVLVEAMIFRCATAAASSRSRLVTVPVVLLSKIRCDLVVSGRRCFWSTLALGGGGCQQPERI
jgi:hypothetical protein